MKTRPVVIVAMLFVACGELPGPSEEPIAAPARDAGAADDAQANGDASGDPCALPKTACGDAGAICLLSKRCGMPRAAGATCGASWECASGRCDPTSKTCVTDANACGIFFDGCADRACCSGLRCIDVGNAQKRCEQCEVTGVACPDDAGAAGCCSGKCAMGICE